LALYGKPIESGNASGADIPMPVFIEFRNIGTELARVTQAANIEIDCVYSEMLLADLEPLMEAAPYEKLKAGVSGSPVATREGLRALGLRLVYQADGAAIRIEMPHEWLRPFVLGLGEDPGSLRPNLAPAPISGYVNLRASEQAAVGSATQPGLAAGPAASASGVVSARGASLIGGANYSSQALARTETAIVVPWDKGLSQLWLGDARYSNASTIQYPQMSGASYFKKARASNDHSEIDAGVISAKNKSKIQIYKNESLYREMEVPPGDYRLSDLQLDLGQNAIRIVVRDEATGEVKERLINDFLPLYSVPRGEWEGVASAGFRRSSDAAGLAYSAYPAAFGGFAYGVSRVTNAGLDAYSSSAVSRLTEELRLFQNIGSLALSVSQSASASGADGSSVKAAYVKSNGLAAGLESVSISEELQSPGYSPAAQSLIEPPPNPGAATATSVNVGLQPIWRVAAGLGYTGIRSEPITSDSYYANLSKSYGIDRHWSMSVTAGKLWSDQGASDVRLLVTLAYADVASAATTKGLASVGSSQNLARASYADDNRLLVSAEASGPPGASGPTTQSVSAKKAYSSGDVGGGVANIGGETVATAEIATGIAFTDRTAAFTRPLSGGFIIFESRADKGAEFDVSSDSGGAAASGGSAFRAVAVPVPDYSISSYSAAYSDPAYFTLESSRAYIYQSGFKTGSSVFLASDPRSIVSGTLLDERRRPVAQAFADISCLSPTDSLEGKVLTNGLGEFQASIKRGASCRLVIDDKKTDLLDLSWPVRFRNLGALTIK
jgi:hypothetical protein